MWTSLTKAVRSPPLLMAQLTNTRGQSQVPRVDPSPEGQASPQWGQVGFTGPLLGWAWSRQDCPGAKSLLLPRTWKRSWHGVHRASSVLCVCVSGEDPHSSKIMSQLSRQHKLRTPHPTLHLGPGAWLQHSIHVPWEGHHPQLSAPLHSPILLERPSSPQGPPPCWLWPLLPN